MLASRFIRYTRLDELGRDEAVPDRAVAITFTARFVDEVTSGAWLVLTPVFRRALRLSLIQVGLLSQVLGWVALVVEPVTTALIDVSSRRLLMAVGAAALAASMLTMGLAGSFAVLLLAFGLFGLGSGPLANTADVVAVETYPDAPDRAFTRATMLDTSGALLGPALIAAASVAGISWRAVLILLGAVSAVYAIGIAGTRFRAPPGLHAEGTHLLRHLAISIGGAARRPGVRRALLVMLCFDLFEAAFVLEYIWLHDHVGLSEALIAAWAAGEQLVALVALAALDRVLQRVAPGRVLSAAAAALVWLPAAWVAVPGVGGRILIGVPLAACHAVVWPLAKTRALTVAPDAAGAVQAITTLFPIIPLALLESVLADAVGVGPAMATTAAVGALTMMLAIRGELATS